MYQSCVSVHEIQRHFCEMYKCMCRSNYYMTYYQSVYRYSCFAQLCRLSKIKKKKKVVQSNPNVSHFIDSINNGPTQKKYWKWLLTTPRSETNDGNVPWCTPQQNRMLSLSSCICKPCMRQVFGRPWKQNVGSMLLALLLFCPCINRQSSGTLAMTQRFGLSK